MSSPLGIIAGSGNLPLRLIESCRLQSRPVFILGFEDSTDMRHYSHLPHAKIRLGAIGEGIAHLRQAGVKDIVMAGAIKRPGLSGLRPDAAGAKLMSRLGSKLLFGGDDALLKAIISFLEEEGFTVLGADTLLENLLAPSGILGKISPTPTQQADITFGMKEAKHLGKRDLGQAVIVENGKLLGTEDTDGTDALIARCAIAPHVKGHGVLIKAKKPGQESRADLPAIGLHTVEKIHAAGFSGIAVEAGASLILDKEQAIAKADALGLFIVGVSHD